MAHGSKIISQIKLPNNEIYEIHDKHAIHELTLEQIEALGLQGAFIYKGVVDTVAALNNKEKVVGYVYHVLENGSEYVWTTENKWEEFGHHMVVEHTHEFEGSGSVTVTGENAESDVTASGSISVPKVETSANYLKVNSSIGDVAVAGDGTAAPITGFGAHTTAKAITELNSGTIKQVQSITEISASHISENQEITASKVEATAGSAANLTMTVEADDTLVVAWTANVPTVVSATDVQASKITASEVKASAVVDEEVSVVTGSKSTADAITALGEATTATVLTGVKVSTQPTLSVSLVSGGASDVKVGDTVTISSEDKTVTVNGKAEAQVWTQKTGTATISGTTESAGEANH